MEEMIKCIEKVSEYTQVTCGVTNNQGRVLACTDESLVNTEIQAARDLLLGEDKFLVTGGYSYQRIQDSVGNDFACFIQSDDSQSQSFVQLLSCWLSEVVRGGTTEMSRESLLKNILLENELPGDIPLKARDHRIPYAVRRVAIVIQLNGSRSAATVSGLRNLLPNRRADYMLLMDEDHIVILKEVTQEHHKQIEQFVADLLEYFGEVDGFEVCLGIGMPAETLKDCAKSYREASLALTVGGIFDHESPVMYYDKLGLGRLIYQLPATLCQMFLDEVFPNDAYDSLDEETLLTINKFFENNLNGSETARQLFVHRNTLVYRLDKVQKITNLDLRSFDDAVLFKLASMVRQYLEKQGSNSLGHPMRWWRN